MAALAAGAFSTRFFQSLLFGAMAASAAILATYFIVAVNEPATGWSKARGRSGEEGGRNEPLWRLLDGLRVPGSPVASGATGRYGAVGLDPGDPRLA